MRKKTEVLQQFLMRHFYLFLVFLISTVELQASCKAELESLVPVSAAYWRDLQGVDELALPGSESDKNWLVNFVLMTAFKSARRNAESDQIIFSGKPADRVLVAVHQHADLQALTGEYLLRFYPSHIPRIGLIESSFPVINSRYLDQLSSLQKGFLHHGSLDIGTIDFVGGAFSIGIAFIVDSIAGDFFSFDPKRNNLQLNFFMPLIFTGQDLNSVVGDEHEEAIVARFISELRIRLQPLGVKHRFENGMHEFYFDQDSRTLSLKFFSKLPREF